MPSATFRGFKPYGYLLFQLQLIKVCLPSNLLANLLELFEIISRFFVLGEFAQQFGTTIVTFSGQVLRGLCVGVLRGQSQMDVIDGVMNVAILGVCLCSIG